MQIVVSEGTEPSPRTIQGTNTPEVKGHLPFLLESFSQYPKVLLTMHNISDSVLIDIFGKTF